MAREVTLREWNRRWGNIAYISFRLDFNAFNFVVMASKFASRFFKSSFRSQRFYKSGQSRWEKRKDNLPHKILLETGELMNSIEYSGVRPTFLQPSATVSTNERYGNRKGKKMAGYAAVHNEPASKTGFSVNQYSRKKPIQRQFMGHNKELYKQIAQKYNKVLKRGLF